MSIKKIQPTLRGQARPCRGELEVLCHKHRGCRPARALATGLPSPTPALSLPRLHLVSIPQQGQHLAKHLTRQADKKATGSIDADSRQAQPSPSRGEVTPAWGAALGAHASFAHEEEFFPEEVEAARDLLVPPLGRDDARHLGTAGERVSSFSNRRVAGEPPLTCWSRSPSHTAAGHQPSLLAHGQPAAHQHSQALLRRELFPSRSPLTHTGAGLNIQHQDPQALFKRRPQCPDWLQLHLPSSPLQKGGKQDPYVQ